jgi:DNA-binding HxlR family transcriptional regulator
MNESSKYYELIPLIIRNSIKGLNNKHRQNILCYLLTKGKTSYTKLQKEIGISKSLLANHLQILMKYALIYNSYNAKHFREEYSFYEISKLGNKILQKLINMVCEIL